MTAKKTDYKTLNDELEDVLAALSEGNLDVDAAMQQYARGLELVQLLEEHLKLAGNTVVKLKARQSGSDKDA